MSKKNRNKRKFTSGPSDVESSFEQAGGEAVEAGTKTGQTDVVRQELKKLAFVAVVIILILSGIYFYDKQTQILQNFTHSLFSLF